MPKFVLLWTDATVWLLIAGLCVYAVVVARSPALSANWRKVFRDAPALGSSVLLMLCLVITLLDSLHYRPLLPPAAGATNAAPAYESRTRSVLDAVLSSLVDSREATYSRPLAYVGFTKESVEVNGQIDRVAPRLKHGGAHLTDPAAQWAGDVTTRILKGLVFGLLFTVATAALLFAAVARSYGVAWSQAAGTILRGESDIPWCVALWTLLVTASIGGPIVALMGHYHVFGTDLTGNDVFYQALKSIRTAFVIGTLATITEFAVPQPGLMVIKCVGLQRFNVTRSEKLKHGLWVADVARLPDDQLIAVPEDLQPVSRALGNLIRTLQERAIPDDQMPMQPPYELDDCGWVANRWCELLSLPLDVKQRLMALDNPLVRLELVGDMLARSGIMK
mgnify:CR=1 FL=1